MSSNQTGDKLNYIQKCYKNKTLGWSLFMNDKYALKYLCSDISVPHESLGCKYELNTKNKLNRLLECSSVKFTPIKKVYRPTVTSSTHHESLVKVQRNTNTKKYKILVTIDSCMLTNFTNIENYIYIVSDEFVNDNKEILGNNAYMFSDEFVNDIKEIIGNNDYLFSGEEGLIGNEKYIGLKDNDTYELLYKLAGIAKNKHAHPDHEIYGGYNDHYTSVLKNLFPKINVKSINYSIEFIKEKFKEALKEVNVKKYLKDIKYTDIDLDKLIDYNQWKSITNVLEDIKSYRIRNNIRNAIGGSETIIVFTVGYKYLEYFESDFYYNNNFSNRFTEEVQKTLSDTHMEIIRECPKTLDDFKKEIKTKLETLKNIKTQ